MILELIFIFILGLMIGSFLNCILYRVGKKKSFLKGRSYCPHCKHNLKWSDLIPLFSFLFLKGKCHYCKKPISFQYPLIELITGLFFVFIYNYFNVNLIEYGLHYNLYQAIFYFIIISVFILIFIYDFKHYIILDEFIIFGIITVVLWLGFNYFYKMLTLQELLIYFYSAISASFFFFSLWFLTKGKGMGFGDVKLAFFLGLLLGFPNVVFGIFLSFILGAIIGLGLVIFKKRKLKSAVPFGPFLVIGCLIVIFYGTELANWYFSLSLPR